jgi:hypothetical protein
MSPPDAPLSASDLDELLSADLDGELERAAAAFGLTLDDARDAIATPEARARRAALAGAARFVAAPVDLPSGAAGPMVAGALAAARAENELEDARRRRARRADTARKVLVAAGSAAAVVVVIVGLAHLPRGGSDSKSTAASVPPPSESSGHAAAEAGGFGGLDSPEQLRRRVAVRLPSPAPQFDATTGTTERGAAPSSPRGAKAVDGPSTDQALDKLASCRLPARRAAAASAAPVLSGAATWRGRPAYVFVFREGDGYRAVVVARADCAVLTTVEVS